MFSCAAFCANCTASRFFSAFAASLSAPMALLEPLLFFPIAIYCSS
jgi:hypothetical protein